MVKKQKPKQNLHSLTTQSEDEINIGRDARDLQEIESICIEKP